MLGAKTYDMASYESAGCIRMQCTGGGVLKFGGKQQRQNQPAQRAGDRGLVADRQLDSTRQG